MVSLDSSTKALISPTAHVFAVLPFSGLISSSVTRHCDSHLHRRGVGFGSARRRSPDYQKPRCSALLLSGIAQCEDLRQDDANTVAGVP
jgi:hypothetical protein